jgi:divalent metal cation (Fe/Co/Zn/Cd) transporter
VAPAGGGTLLVMSTSGFELPVIQASAPSVAGPERGALVRRARALAWFGIGWHVIEAAVAILAGLAASSVALIGFGADSVIESAAGFVVLWRFATSRPDAERRAQRLIALSFYLLAAYIAVDAARSLIVADEPSVSWVGIGLAAVTVVLMPPLAIAKGRVGAALSSSATASEGRQNMVCAYLSAGLLVGLGLNAAFGWWWADPIVAFGIAGVAVREGRQAWRGEDSCCAVPGLSDGCC